MSRWRDGEASSVPLPRRHYQILPLSIPLFELLESPNVSSARGQEGFPSKGVIAGRISLQGNRLPLRAGGCRRHFRAGTEPGVFSGCSDGIWRNQRQVKLPRRARILWSTSTRFTTQLGRRVRWCHIRLLKEDKLRALPRLCRELGWLRVGSPRRREVATAAEVGAEIIESITGI